MSEEKKKEVISKEEAKKVAEQLKEVADIAEVEEMIKNNEIQFDYKKVKYRVRRPNYGEKRQLYDFRTKEFNKMLMNSDYKLEKELREIYQSRGINIIEIEKEMRRIQKKITDNLFKAGKEIADKEPSDKLLQSMKKENEELNEQLKTLSIQKTSLLESSIESQLESKSYFFLAYLLTEKEVKKDKKTEWKSVWESFEELQKDDEVLVNRAAFYSSLIVVIGLDMQEK